MHCVTILLELPHEAKASVVVAYAERCGCGLMRKIMVSQVDGL